jgi:primosomal protein N' (replication factor Y)
MDLGRLRRALPRRDLGAILEQLQRKKLITREEKSLGPRVRPKATWLLKLKVSREEAKALQALPKGGLRGEKARALLALLLEKDGEVGLAEARSLLGPLASATAALERRGLLVRKRVEVWRDPLEGKTYPVSPPLHLTESQEKAWQALREGIASGGGHRVFLLQGVTGSGKTELYLLALAEVIRRGQGAIVMVPEIALTPQTVERFASRFPGRVAVLHSALSPGEHLDEWRRISSGQVDVVIGSRGAIFAPLPRLGLIVMDEEHEWTYKQEQQPPRYHAREVAIKLAELKGAVLLLGSATPDVASYWRAEEGAYTLLSLPERVGGGPGRSSLPLPQVEVVDLRRELREGNRSIFSRSLQRAMATALDKGDQVILFLNRRGSASVVVCRDCGYVVRCRRCDLPLTYHAQEEGLVCHQCNLRRALPERCPECWGQRIRYLGVGTQKVAEEVASLFPGARVLRWDRDVTQRRRAHEAILEKFTKHQADVLIGTQMIAKGLHLPLVTLVGVVNADQGLHLPDFRAGERVFQLLTQVAGRAGRGPRGGRVIIQTYNPHHYALVAASHHDYQAFYQQETAFRRRLGYPPFSHLARLVYSHPNAQACQREAQRLSRRIQEELEALGATDLQIIGPAPCYVSRLRGRYRWQLILRGSQPQELLREIPLPRGWTLDVDPGALL